MHGGWAGLLPVLLLLAASVGACAPAAPEPAQEPTVDTLRVGGDSTLVDSPLDNPGDPFFGFDLDRTVASTTDQQELALRLRNEGLEDVLVFADAGAGEVWVDSVSAGGWTRVDLVTRAPVVTLRSTDLGGRFLRRLEITVDVGGGVDSVREVIVSAP